MENVTGSPINTVTSILTKTFRGNAGENFFSWYDYVLFGTMLAISGGIGIYFGCFGKKQTTTTDYLLGGKNMNVVAIAISLIASHTSGITLLGVPSDVYVFGASYGIASISMLVLGVITIFAFLPVFYELQLTSTYEYLGLRFDIRTRKWSSILFALAVFLHIPIVIYIPALAFSAATGIDVHLVTPVVCGICIFYTTIGGLKALVWADTVQFSVTFGAVSVLLVLGVIDSGGVSEVWKKAVDLGRLDILEPLSKAGPSELQSRVRAKDVGVLVAFTHSCFFGLIAVIYCVFGLILSFDIDFTKRETVWALLIGMTVHWISMTSVNQSCTQKFLSVSTLKNSKRAVLLYCTGMALVKLISVFTGLVLSARYADCDPFITKQIQRNDQLLPYYVLDVAKHIPGLSGLFIAGVFSASLSALSGNLNCLSGTIYEDFLRQPLQRKGIKNDGLVLKILVVIIGIISTILVYVVENLGGILALSIELGSIAHGPLLAMFALGLFFPVANKQGAFYGSISSVIFMSAITCVKSYYKSAKMLKFAHKMISVDGCDFYVNTTVTTKLINSTMTGAGSDVFPIFRLSFYWNTLIGATIGIIIGLSISYMTEKNDPPVSRDLLSPLTRCFLSGDVIEDSTNLEYYGVQEALGKVANGNTDRRESMTEEMKRERLRKASYVSEVLDI